MEERTLFIASIVVVVLMIKLIVLRRMAKRKQDGEDERWKKS